LFGGRKKKKADGGKTKQCKVEMKTNRGKGKTSLRATVGQKEKRLKL